MESIDVTGLECEEALAIVRMYARQNKVPCSVVSASVPFYRLLVRWAEATEHRLLPAVVPVQGTPWYVTISKVGA